MTDQFRVWLDRRTATIHMEQAVSRAVLEANTNAPIHKHDPAALPAPGEMRGIPAIGRTCPGAIPGTRPDHRQWR